jgi:hypothetical protein
MLTPFKLNCAKVALGIPINSPQAHLKTGYFDGSIAPELRRLSLHSLDSAQLQNRRRELGTF